MSEKVVALNANSKQCVRDLVDEVMAWEPDEIVIVAFREGEALTRTSCAQRSKTIGALEIAKHDILNTP